MSNNTLDTEMMRTEIQRIHNANENLKNVMNDLLAENSELKDVIKTMGKELDKIRKQIISIAEEIDDLI